MIYKDGKLWEGWQQSQGSNKQKSATKSKKDLNKLHEFILTDLYKHQKQIQDKEGNPTGKTVPMYAPLVSIPPYYSWIDPSDNSTHEIRYVEKEGASSRKMMGGEPILTSKFSPEEIEFVDGYYRVPGRKEDLFWFMMNYPINQSNKIYENEAILAAFGGRFTFYYRDTEAEQEKALNTEIEIAQAINLAASGLTKEEQRDLYLVLHPAADRNASEKVIMAYLISEARTNPKRFLAEYKNDDKGVMSLINEAKQYQVLKYLANVRFWKFSDNEEPFCSVPRGVKPELALLEFFRKQDLDGATQNVIRKALAKAKEEPDEE